MIKAFNPLCLILGGWTVPIATSTLLELILHMTMYDVNYNNYYSGCCPSFFMVTQM